MNLEHAVLDRESIRVHSCGSFRMPIHPALLREDISLDTALPLKVFEQAAQEWYEDFQRYISSLPIDDPQAQEYKSAFLPRTVSIESRYGAQKFNGWEDNVRCSETGFAEELSISRNGGGSLYVNPDGVDTYPFSLSSPNQYLHFSQEQLVEYAQKHYEERGSVRLNLFSSHNIDSYPGALFLRNWAVAYMNAALKELDANKKV